MARRNEDEGEETSGTRTVRGVGDNSDKVIDGKKLQGFIDRFQKLNAKKEQILQEIREEFADAKAVGFDGKSIRIILRRLKTEPEKLKEQDETLELHQRALGLLDE